MKHMRKEIFDYLRTGQEAVARIRVEHIIREENIMAAYEIIELFCEFVLARVPILEAQKDCPMELQEAVSSIIFASPRCSDLPELIQIRNLFTVKYGKEFVAAASELRPDSNVNRLIIEKLSPRAPSSEVKLKTLKGIANEYHLDWDSSSTEADFSKKHEDLLDGSVPMSAQDSPPKRPLHVPSPSKAESSPIITNFNSKPNAKKTEAPPKDDKPAIKEKSSDVMEMARAAIAAADRATAAARAAAELARVRMPLPSHTASGNTCT